MNNAKDFEKLPVPQSIRNAVAAILGSETGQKALAEYDNTGLKTRTDLVARRQAIPGLYADRRREAVQRTETAARNLRDAKDRLRQCNDEYMAAATASYGLELHEERENQEINRELIRSADHRLAG